MNKPKVISVHLSLASFSATEKYRIAFVEASIRELLDEASSLVPKNGKSLAQALPSRLKHTSRYSLSPETETKADAFPHFMVH